MDAAYKRVIRIALLAAFCLPLLVFFGPQDRSQIVPVNVTNAYQDSIATDWRRIEALLPGHEYVLEYFKMDFTTNGDIRRIDWRISWSDGGPLTLFYDISRNGEDEVYYVERSETEHPYTYKIPMDDFCRLVTPEAIRAISPRDPDYVSLIISPTLHTIDAATRPEYYALSDGQVQGPLKEGIGYVASVFPMYTSRDVSASRVFDRYYLLGGTYSL